MCLGVPGRVLRIDGLDATVDFFGVCKQVRLDVVDAPVSVGDYVLNHVGFAIRRIPPGEVDATLALFDAILGGSRPDDLMAADVRGEIDAAAPAIAEDAAREAAELEDEVAPTTAPACPVVVGGRGEANRG